jgi:MFS family permease
MLALLCTGLCYGMVMLFNLLGAFLLQSHMGYSPIQYGHYALIMGFGWTVGGLSNRRFLHTNFYKKVKIASILAIVIAAIMFGLGLIATNIWLIIIPALLMHCCAGFIFNNYFAFCLSVFPQYAGTSNGVQGSGNYLITFAVSAILAAILPSNTPLSLAGGYLGLAILCLIVFYFILRLPPIKMSKTVDLSAGH